MTEPEELEDIREQKRRELLERADGETAVKTATESGSPDEPVSVRDATHLDELTARHELVLVDFYADWCGPCKMLEPTVEAIAADTPAVVAKVDIDRHQDLAGRAGVRGVPTLVLYRHGEPVEQLVGVQDEGSLRQLIARHS